MKIGILDDEKNVTNTLRGYVEKYAEEHGLAISAQEFQRAADLLAKYDNDYDILFFDIEMPGIDGLETAKRIRALDENVVIVFITNMAQYAIKGYEVHAADFVLKPLSYADFALKMTKAVRFITPPRRNPDKSIPLRATDGLVSVKISQINFIEVRKNYLYYNTDGGEYKVRGTMKIAESELAGCDFYRISNCYLVNMKKIAKVGSGSVTAGGTELPVSRYRKADFIKRYISFSSGIL